MLDQRAFHLERPDAVAGGDDDIISPADEPEVAVLIFIRLVARQVPVAVERPLHSLIVLPVFGEQSYRAFRLDFDGNLPLFAHGNFAAVFVNDADGEAGHGLAHRAGAHRQTAEVADNQHRFRLPVAVIDGPAGAVFPLLHHFGVQRLPGAGAVAQTAQIVLRQVFQYHHPVGGGRGAERSYAEPFQHPQRHSSVEPAARVVLHHCGPLRPLAEQLAVGRFGPAGVGKRPVQVGGLQVVPVFGGQRVADGAGGLGVQHHLGVAHRAGSEVDEQRVVAAGWLYLAQQRRTVGHLALEGMPAAPFAAHRRQMPQAGTAGGGLGHLAGVFGVGDGHYRVGAVDAVFDVAGRQQGSGRHGQGAQLEQRQHRHIPFGDAGQHQEHPVALADTQLAQRIGVLVGKGFQVPKGMVPRLFARRGHRQQGQLGAVGGPLVNHIEAEIEVFRHFQPLIAVGAFVVRHIGG